MIQGRDLHASAKAKTKICHVTGHVVDAANNKCKGVVIEVGGGAVGAHLNHGDVLAPPEMLLEVGDKVVMNCAP